MGENTMNIEPESMVYFTDFTLDLAKKICFHYGVAPGKLFSRKEQKVHRARRSLIFGIMDRWVQQYRDRVLVLRQVHSVLDFPNTHFKWSKETTRISQSIMGQLLDLDHVTIRNAFIFVRRKPDPNCLVLCCGEWIPERTWYDTRWNRQSEPTIAEDSNGHLLLGAPSGGCGSDSV